MARPRTTKDLAKRIELDYYRRPDRWRRWRRNAALGAASLAALWLVIAGLRGDQRMYNSGPLSVRHAVFGAQCEACHVKPEGSRFFLRTTDKACLACHDGPTHHDSQVFTPECVSCHVEHKGHVVLADLSDQHCTRCHDDLTVKQGSLQIEARVSNFGVVHPEFAILRSGARDSAQVKLNHEVHLKAGLRGPNGPVQMVCGGCHRAGSARAAWPYGQPGASTSAPVPYVRGAYMNRIVYADQCVGCHPLGFDARTTQAVPHDKPEVVRAFLRLFYLDYAAAHPDDLHGEPEDGGGLRRGRDDDETPAAPPEQWIAAQIEAAETLLYRTKSKGCQYCHVMEDGSDAGGLPHVAATGIPARWFAHATFDHRTHRELRCVACHEKAAASRDTADVLLPGINSCRKCHEAGGARMSCVECHRYHDKTRERDPNGPLTIEQLVRARP